MKEEWLMSGAVVPVDVETTAALVAEIKRLIDVVGGMALQAKMLEFIETQDGNYCDEWYASPRDFAATILIDFAQYLGLELVVQEHIPQLKKPDDRNAMLQSWMPEIQRLFNAAYKERT
jgi:hypothetical protein